MQVCCVMATATEEEEEEDNTQEEESRAVHSEDPQGNRLIRRNDRIRNISVTRTHVCTHGQAHLWSESDCVSWEGEKSHLQMILLHF